MSWNDGQNIRLAFNQSVPKKMRPSFAAAADIYNQTLTNTSLNLTTSSDSAPDMKNNDPQSVSGDGINGIYWIDGTWPWAESDPNSDAMTVVNFSESGITEADVFFRAQSFSGEVWMPASKSDDSVAPESVKLTPADLSKSSRNLQWVYMIAVHEFGHVLGRVHSHREDSIMWPSIGLDGLDHPFTQYDLDIFAKKYKLRK